MQSDLSQQQSVHQPLTTAEFMTSTQPPGIRFRTLLSTPLVPTELVQMDAAPLEEILDNQPITDETGFSSSKQDQTHSVRKGKSKSKLSREPKRMKWSNDMISELLKLRFSDGKVKQRIDSADTKTKKALAWQFFASVLSQSLGLVISQDQVYQKYRKLKSQYQKEKREMRKTGNDTSGQKEFDPSLWEILNDAFASKEGLSGDVLADTSESIEETSSQDTEVAENSTPKAKLPPVTQLAKAMENGMTAIATAMSTQPPADDNLRALAVALEQQTRAFETQQQETRQFQELQLKLLQKLLEKSS